MGLTFSIALLVRPSLDALLPFLALRVDAFFCDAIFDTAEAGAGVVTLLAGFLAVCAGVLDLPALCARGLGSHHSGREWVHMHSGHPRVGDGVHGHRGLIRVGGGLGAGGLLIIVRV